MIRLPIMRLSVSKMDPKFATFKRVAEPLWLKEPPIRTGDKVRIRDNPLDASLFSMEGAKYTQWYKDLDTSDATAVAAVVTQKMASLHELFYKLVRHGDKEVNNNFFKNHRATLVHYAMWCNMNHMGDYAMNSEHKAAAYLEERANSVVRNIERERATVGEAETMFNAYRNTVAALERLALWQGYGKYANDLSKYEPIMVLRSRLFGERNVERAGPRDHAADSRLNSKRLAPSESRRMTEAYWTGDMYEDGYKTVTKAHRAQMRDLWFHNAQYEIGRRGQDLRALRYSMFMVHELDCVKPVKPCYALVASLRHAKEVTNNTEIPISWVRTFDREKCPIGATASNLVWQNDIVGIQGASLISIMKKDLHELDKLGKKDTYAPKWRELFFVHSKNAKEEISYSTHRKGVVTAFEAGNIQKTAKTQVYRTTRACELIEKGVAFTDVGVFQGWWHDTAADVYLKASIKAGPLLQAAGWDGMDKYHCWWESADGDIPDELLKLVFPGLDELTELAERVNTKTGKDLSAVKVCEVLKLMRKVYIEDAVVHRSKYPNFPAYVGHQLFAHKGWEPFVQAETERVKQRQQQWEVSQRDPTLARAIQDQLQNKDDAIRELKGMVQELIAERRSSVPVAEPMEEIEQPSPPKEADGPIPSLFEPSSMASAFEQWDTVQRANFNYYIDSGIPIRWKEFYKETASAMRQRYHKMKPWLFYMDDMVAEGRVAGDVIAEFARIAAKYRVDEGVFIKDAFYHLVHPPSGKMVPRIVPSVLRAEMQAVGLPLPEEKKKRQYRKRKAAESDDM